MARRKSEPKPEAPEQKKKRLTEEAYFTLEAPKGGAQGRPSKVLNELGRETVEKLAMLQCSIEEIAAFMCSSPDTLNNSHNKAIFRELYKRGQENGKRTIRAALFKNIHSGNVAATIFACKSILGMSDNVQTSAESSILSGFVKTIDEMAEDDDSDDPGDDDRATAQDVE